MSRSIEFSRVALRAAALSLLVFGTTACVKPLPTTSIQAEIGNTTPIMESYSEIPGQHTEFIPEMLSIAQKDDGISLKGKSGATYLLDQFPDSPVISKPLTETSVDSRIEQQITDAMQRIVVSHSNLSLSNCNGVHIGDGLVVGVLHCIEQEGADVIKIAIDNNGSLLNPQHVYTMEGTDLFVADVPELAHTPQIPITDTAKLIPGTTPVYTYASMKTEFGNNTVIEHDSGVFTGASDLHWNEFPNTKTVQFEYATTMGSPIRDGWSGSIVFTIIDGEPYMIGSHIGSRANERAAIRSEVIQALIDEIQIAQLPSKE